MKPVLPLIGITPRFKKRAFALVNRCSGITVHMVVINRNKLQIYDTIFKDFENSLQITLITKSIMSRRF